MPTVSQGHLVGVAICMLTASYFHQSRLQPNTLTCQRRESDWPARPPNRCSHYVAAVYLALALSLILGDGWAPRKRLQQLPLKSFVGGLSLAPSLTTSQLPRAMPPPVCLSVSQLICLSAIFLSLISSFGHTSRASRHLTLRLCTASIGPWGGNVDRNDICHSSSVNGSILAITPGRDSIPIIKF